MKFDLATRFLEKEHNVFRVFPGRRYKFFAEFIENNIVFLDFPGSKITLNDEQEVISPVENVIMGTRISQHYRSKDETKKVPSNNLEDYDGTKTTASRQQNVGYIKAMFEKLKPGDLVIVPGRSFNEPVYIGEISSEFKDTDRFESRFYPDHPVQVRKVKWIGKQQKKANFSARLIEILSNNNVIVQIKDLNIKKEIYQLAYDKFVVSDYSSAKFRVESEVIDFRDLTQVGSYLTYLAGMYLAEEKNQLSEYIKSPIGESNDALFKETLINTIIEIHSPGFIGWITDNLALPIVVSLLVAAAAANLTLEEAKAIEIVNNLEDTPSACQLEVEEKYANIMKILGEDHWHRICEEYIKSKDSAGLKGGVIFEPNAKN